MHFNNGKERAAFEGYTQKEIGKCFGITQYALSKRLRKTRGTINKLCKKQKINSRRLYK